jgi:immune inhibitor A
MILMGLAPTVMAQEPQGATEKDYVPPRPDLMAVLQQQGALPQAGNGLDAAAGPAETAYQQYLAQKLGPQAFRDSAVKGRAEGKHLQQAGPANNRMIVALVDYANLAHNGIPKPSTQNNTDWWVSDFSSSYYASLLFGNQPANRSLRNFLYEASNETYDLAGEIHDWAAVTGNADTYGDDLASGGVDNDLADGTDVYELIRDAADTLSAWVPTAGWSAYCSNTTTIDYFVVVHAGKGQESGGGGLGNDAVWSVHGALTQTYQIGTQGIYVQNFIVVSEDAPIGVFAHEMGHMFGLPDTWNPTSGLEVSGPRNRERANAANVGEPSPAFWDPMAYGCWLGMPLGSRPAVMTSWECQELNWLTLTEWTLTDMPASTYLAQLETFSQASKALKINLNPRIYVSPHSPTHMRQAPDPTDMTSPSILSHTFQITAATTAQLTFYQWYDLETNLDVGYVEVASSSGGAFTTVFTVTGTSSGWALRTLALDSYVSSIIDVRFRLARDPNIRKLGWFLDDFALVQDGVTTWSDSTDTGGGAAGPVQGAGNYQWSALRFPWNEAYVSNHYYLAEWRNDDTPLFDDLRVAYHMTDMVNGWAEYFKYNPGLLVWYVNPIYNRNWDNDVLLHPGDGFLLAVDAHPDPLLQSTGIPWRTRVQMQDAAFRKSASTYPNSLTDSAGVLRNMPPLAATTYFLDWWASYPYWRSSSPDNSAKTPEYGVKLEIENENPDKSGAVVRFSIDAGDMRTSRKTVDKATASPGDVLLYTIVLTNTGHADAYTIVVSDTAPAHTTYLTDTYTVAGSPSWAITQTNGIRWQGTVLLTSPVTITFQVRLDRIINNGTVIENVAHVLEGTVPEVDLYARTTVNSAPCLTSSTKTSSPTHVLAGDIVTYTIALINSGSSDATVTITDCIPAYTTYVSPSFTVIGATSGSGGYNPQANCIYWTGLVPALDPPAPAVTLTFQVMVNRCTGYCNLVTNRATINDRFHQPFDITANTTIDAGPNLRESIKKVSPDTSVAVKPGDRLTYTIFITNTGNQNASVTMSDTIPMNTSYVSGSLSCSGGTCGTDGASVHFTGTLGSLATAMVTFRVDITHPLTSGTIITNTADIVENGVKTYTREVTSTVLSEPRLSNSRKDVSGTSAGYGGVLTYTITLINDGTLDTTVTITDAIPLNTQYVLNSLAYTSGVGWDNGGAGPITWSGTVVAGTSVTVSFEVTITLVSTGVISNCATVNDAVHAPFSICSPEVYVGALEIVTPTQTVYCGDLIAIPVRVSGVSDLQGYQVTTTFDPAVLRIETISSDPWFTPLAYFNYTPIVSANLTGTLTVYAALHAQPTGKSGSGTLYTMYFRAVGSGSTTIWITDSLLSDTPDPSFTPIPHNRVSGTFTIDPRNVQGIAWLQGRTNFIGATVEAIVGTTTVYTTTTDSGGNYSVCPPVGAGQNFLLRISKTGYLRAEKLVGVPVSGTFTLNTVTLLGGDPIGTQVTVSRTYPCTATWVIAGPPDAKVNVLDLTFVGARFLKDSTAPDWGQPPVYCRPDYITYRADINEDTFVNIFDLVLVGNNFGRIGLSPWP